MSFLLALLSECTGVIDARVVPAEAHVKVSLV